MGDEPSQITPEDELEDDADETAGEAESAPAGLSALLHRRMPVYDKDREGHYNLISALHKSLRGSDPQAALGLV